MTKGHGNIIGVFGGCHQSDGFIATAIMVFTSAPWRWFTKKSRRRVSSHSSIGWIYEDGYREIFEAREGKSWQGPIPVKKIEAWVARDKKGRRRFTMYDIPSDIVNVATADRKYKTAERYLKIWTYNTLQLPRMGIRTLFPFIPMKYSPEGVVCSEAATVLLETECAILRICGKKNPDLITPVLFEKAMKHICAVAKKEVTNTDDAYQN